MTTDVILAQSAPYTCTVPNQGIHFALTETADSLAQVLDSVSCDITRLDEYRPAPLPNTCAADMQRLFGYQVEFLGRSTIFAMSHMSAMATVIRGATSVYSPHVLCRAVLEPLGYLYWACDQQLGTNGTLLGILRTRMSEQPRALKLLRDQGADERAQEAEAIINGDRLAHNALREGLSRTQYRRTKQPNATDAVSTLMAGHETKRMTAYGLLSEHSHGNTTWVGAKEFTDTESLKRLQPTQAAVSTFLWPALMSLEGMFRAFGRVSNFMPLRFNSELLTDRISHLTRIAHAHGDDDVWQPI